MADFLSDLKDILFLDIETVSGVASLHDLPDRLKEEWLKKSAFLDKNLDLTPEELYLEKAGIYAEFGKVACIGIGYFQYDPEKQQLQFRTKSLAEELEHDTLLGFREILEKKQWTLCAHNGKEFDFPYLCRRMLVNRIPLPDVLQMAGKKPWEIHHLDTLELWKFGDYKHYTRLELLATLFDIPSSKEDINGAEVNMYYYHHEDLPSIRKYCLKDVEVTARIYLAYQGLPSQMDIKIINLDENQEIN